MIFGLPVKFKNKLDVALHAAVAIGYFIGRTTEASECSQLCLPFLPEEREVQAQLLAKSSSACL